jgi:hypothetical protein
MHVTSYETRWRQGKTKDNSVVGLQPRPVEKRFPGIEKRRSTRFQIKMKVEVVRCDRAELPSKGETCNISSSGVFFSSNDLIEPGSPIQFFIQLPSEISISDAIRLSCYGHVTRVEAGKDSMVGVAATIDRYEFIRGTQVIV